MEGEYTIMSLDYLNNDPLLQHPKLNPCEMAMIGDVCNPGFKMQRELDACDGCSLPD
jgi:hypothetical protein